MEIRLLRYFLAVAKELHFGRAAQKLNISQPPLSQQIMRLEDELGVRLFIRNKRNVRLTEAGKVLENQARDILRTIEHTVRLVRETRDGTRGSLFLGYVDPAMDGPLPEIIRRFKTEYPKVDLRLQHMTTREQLSSIREGTLQVGFLRYFDQERKGLCIRQFHREKYILAVPRDHSLFREKTATLRALAGEPMVFFPREIQPGLYDAWHRAFSRAGFRPNIVQEAVSKHTSVALVAAGIGLAIVPESTALFERDGVGFVGLAGQTPELTMHLCYREGSSHPVLENFLTLVQGKIGEA